MYTTVSMTAVGVSMCVLTDVSRFGLKHLLNAPIVNEHIMMLLNLNLNLIISMHVLLFKRGKSG
jgi:hypothetical protein